MTEKKLKALLAKWQKILTLQDWVIKIQLVPHLEGKSASTEMSFKCKKAIMEVSTQAHSDPKGFWQDDDVEATLVHELVHVLIETPELVWKEGSAALAMHEAGIERLALALVGLDRKK